MRAPGEDPRFEELRYLVTTLRERLTEFDAHRGTRFARASDELSGNSEDIWRQIEAKVADARDFHDRARQRQRDIRAGQPWTEDLSQALAEVRDTIADMEDARRVADQIARARELDKRVRIVQENARKAGDLGTLARADDLRRLHRTDPLGRNEEETEALEEMGFTAGMRAAVDDLAVLQTARATVVKAAECIAGFDPGDIPSLDDLAAWLTRIQEHDLDMTESSASQQLAVWQARAEEIGEPIFAAEETASALLLQRERLRGELKAAREEAGERSVSERPDVDLLVTQLAELLRTGPLDLDVAEGLMLQLRTLLHGTPRRGR